MISKREEEEERFAAAAERKQREEENAPKPDGKTNGYAADVIENEGVGYAVQHYIDADAFKDPETRRLWAAADRALTALCTYLSDETGREVQ